MISPPREDSGATLALAASVCALSLLAVIVSVCGVISGAMYPELEPVSVVGWEFRLFVSTTDTRDTGWCMDAPATIDLDWLFCDLESDFDSLPETKRTKPKPCTTMGF